MSHHPPHIVDTQNNFSPTAFIPFCSFAGNLSIVGKVVPGFTNPVCTIFSPTVVRNKLCYQVDLNKVKDHVDLRKLMTHGFSFLLDYNEDRQAQGKGAGSGLDQGTPTIWDVTEEDEKEDAMIYIETLGVQELITIDCSSILNY